MKKILIFLTSLLLVGCLTLTESSSSNITVTYLVKNSSYDTEWTVIVYKDVLGSIEEELLMKPGESWVKTLNFRLPEYGSEHLALAAHSLYGTFETTISVNDINQSVSSGSRLKTNGREYLSLSQLFIDRDKLRRYQ